MTKVTDTTIGGGLISLDKRINRRFFLNSLGAVSKKRSLYRRNELKTLPTLSYLPSAYEAWALLSDEVKTDWENAAAIIGMTGYNLFCQDKIYRLKNSIAGNATPSLFHQYKVGYLNLPVSSGHFLFRQVGVDTFTFPATLKVSAYTSLVSENGGSEYLKVRFKYNYDEGGGEQTQANEISLNLSSGWYNDTVSITEHTGQTGHWELEIEGDLIHGDFWFDNFYLLAEGSIVTKDPFCKEVGKKFNKLILPSGATFESIYPAD